MEVQLHSFLISALDQGDWSGSRQSPYNPRESGSCPHCLECWAHSRSSRCGQKSLYPDRRQVTMPTAPFLILWFHKEE